jgi:hypothetical protein
MHSIPKPEEYLCGRSSCENVSDGALAGSVSSLQWAILGSPQGVDIPYGLVPGDVKIRAFYGLGFLPFPETEVTILQNEGTFQAFRDILRLIGEVIFSHVWGAKTEVKRVSVSPATLFCSRRGAMTVLEGDRGFTS